LAYRFRKTGRQILLILLFSLISGLLINDFHPQGLPLSLLSLTFSKTSRKDAWRPLSNPAARDLQQKAECLFVDIRTRKDFQISHIDGAVSLPYPKVCKQLYPVRDTSVQIIIYDSSALSEKAIAVTRVFISKGYGNVFFLRNGFTSWVEENVSLSRRAEDE